MATNDYLLSSLKASQKVLDRNLKEDIDKDLTSRLALATGASIGAFKCLSIVEKEPALKHALEKFADSLEQLAMVKL